jgi:branched-subunit amino acid aminotransferase/4-amino-4-deoxychorismate lyase
MDVGVQFGAVLVERLRTFGGRLSPALVLHRERLQRGMEALGVRFSFSLDVWERELDRLLNVNRRLLNDERDCSLVTTVSPGNPELGGGEGTCMMYLQPLPWERMRSWLSQGTELFASGYCSGAGDCWPAFIKSRSRLSYYLADRGGRGGTLALLQTRGGHVSDTSVANLLISTREGQLVSPRREQIVYGTSLQWVERLLAERYEAIEFRDVAWDELHAAREVILVGNSGCLWHARSLDGQVIGDGKAGPICCGLREAWIQRIGFDWYAQALQPPAEGAGS